MENNFDRYIEQVCHSFASEHKLSGVGFRKLNDHFKALPKTAKTDEMLRYRMEECTNSVINLLLGSAVERQVKLAADLFHMHVNRLFTSHQPSH